MTPSSSASARARAPRPRRRPDVLPARARAVSRCTTTTRTRSTRPATSSPSRSRSAARRTRASPVDVRGRRRVHAAGREDRPLDDLVRHRPRCASRRAGRARPSAGCARSSTAAAARSPFYRAARARRRAPSSASLPMTTAADVAADPAAFATTSGKAVAVLVPSSGGTLPLTHADVARPDAHPDARPADGAACGGDVVSPAQPLRGRSRLPRPPSAPTLLLAEPAEQVG